MNWFAKYLLSALVAFLVSGCILTDEEKKQEGTVNGVSLCIEKNEKQGSLVSKDLIKSQCIQKHEKFKSFRSGPKSWGRVTVEENEIRLVASIKNEFPTFVITAVELGPNYKNAEGVEKEFSEWKSGLWIEPDSASRVELKFSLRERNTAKINKNCRDLEVKINCHEWAILGFRGLDIKLN